MTNEQMIPLEVELLAEQFADGEFPDDADADEWIAARNVFRKGYMKAIEDLKQ